MQLKSQKNNKNRSAYWRGEKLRIFFKRVVLAMSVVIFIVIVLFSIKLSNNIFPIKEIIITGNNNLEEDEIKDVIDTGNDKGMLRISLKDIDKKLKTLPWIKKVSLRKQFPDTLMVKIEETVPKAILNFKGGLFLLDGEGNILEEIKGEKTPFLPVITNIDYKNNKADIMEALKLIEALSQTAILLSKESIEITLAPYGISMNMDGEIFKVGYGKYAEKLQRWKDLEAEVKKRGVTIEYVDLRFVGRVIVKPIKTVKSKQ